jgi:hypothetical protein
VKRSEKGNREMFGCWGKGGGSALCTSHFQPRLSQLGKELGNSFPDSTSSHSCNIHRSPVQTQYHLREDDYQRGEPRWVVVLVPPVDPLQRAGPVACPSPRFNRRKGAANTWRKNHYCAVSELLPSWSGSAFTEIFKSCRLLLFRPRRSLGV